MRQFLSESEKIYFKEIVSKQIFSKEEQLACAKKIAELKKKKAKTKDVKIIEQLEEKIKIESNHLIESCYLMVVKIAKKYRNRYLSLFDLIEEGNYALVKAVDSFDYKKGVKFSTFASTVIKNKILTSIAHRGRSIKRDDMNTYGNPAFVGLTSLSNHTPFQTIKKQIGVDSSKMLKAIKNLKERSTQMELSLSQDIFDDVLLSKNSDPNSPENTLFKKALEDNIQKINHLLTPREYEIVVMHYGLNNQLEKNYREISTTLNLSSERIRQIHDQAMEKIRNSKMNKILRDFLREN